MNYNKFKIFSMISLFVTFEFGQAGSDTNKDQANSYPVSNFIKLMNPTNWGWNSQPVTTSDNQTAGEKRYKEFTNYVQQQSEESARKLEKLKKSQNDFKIKQANELADKQLKQKHLDANNALAAKLQKDINSLEVKLQAASTSLYEIDDSNYQKGDYDKDSEFLFNEVKNSFPQYVEGFKLLGKSEKALYNFIQQQVAIENKKYEDVDLILSYQGDVLQAIEDEITKGMQPIVIAILEKNNPNMIDRLMDIAKIKTMADLTPPFTNRNNQDPIMKYIMDNQDGFMKPIMGEFLRNWITTTVNSNRDTLLHKAAYAGNSELVDLLIKEKANINAEDNYHRTPLCMAIQSSGDEKSVVNIVKMLIKSGTNNLNNEKFFYGQTALCYAVYYADNLNKLAIVRALLEAGAHKNIENYEHKTPLMIAQENNNPDIIALLAQYPDAA